MYCENNRIEFGDGDEKIEVEFGEDVEYVGGKKPESFDVKFFGNGESAEDKIWEEEIEFGTSIESARAMEPGLSRLAVQLALDPANLGQEPFPMSSLFWVGLPHCCALGDKFYPNWGVNRVGCRTWQTYALECPDTCAHNIGDREHYEGRQVELKRPASASGTFITEETEVRKLRQTIVELKEKFGASVNADKFNEYLGDEANVDDLKINFETNTVTVLFSQINERIKGTLRISCDITKTEIVDGEKSHEIVPLAPQSGEQG